jgi:Uma2 family endonuclease
VIDVSFESVTTMSQGEFAAWVAKRASWDRNRYELLNGRIVMNPSAGYPHGNVGNNVQLLLGNFVKSRKLGLVLDSSQGYELPSGDTLEPDHSFVSRARWDAAPEPQPGEFLRVVPDLVVEVLSPSTASRDRGEKKAIYALNGVREYWLVDTRSRELVVFTRGGDDKWDLGRVHSATDRARSTVLDGLELAIAEIFADIE